MAVACGRTSSKRLTCILPKMEYISQLFPSPQRLFSFQSLAKLKASSEKPWCPVRALKWYIKRTEKDRRDIKQLFISLEKPFRPIARGIISHWITSSKPVGPHPRLSKRFRRSQVVIAALPVDRRGTIGHSQIEIFVSFVSTLVVV